MLRIKRFDDNDEEETCFLESAVSERSKFSKHHILRRREELKVLLYS